jgi:hypothetical protein
MTTLTLGQDGLSLIRLMGWRGHMAKISWNPKGRAKGHKPSPIAWGCYVYMREDGGFETEFKGKLDS